MHYLIYVGDKKFATCSTRLQVCCWDGCHLVLFSPLSWSLSGSPRIYPLSSWAHWFMKKQNTVAWHFSPILDYRLRLQWSLNCGGINRMFGGVSSYGKSQCFHPRQRAFRAPLSKCKLQSSLGNWDPHNVFSMLATFLYTIRLRRTFLWYMQ